MRVQKTCAKEDNERFLFVGSKLRGKHLEMLENEIHGSHYVLPLMSIQKMMVRLRH